MKKKLMFMICFLIAIVAYSQDNDLIRSDWTKMHESKSGLYEDYNNLKFGMFIHWGIYSKLGGVWDGEHIDADRSGSQATIGEWIMYSARIPRVKYLDVAKTFNPVGFNAEEWVKIAKDAGMKYIVAMAKHHDGFSMYHTKVSEYNIVDWTPFKRDPIEELYNACQKFGIRMGIYYSHSIDWMDGGDSGNSQINKANPDRIKETRAANLWDPSPVSYTDYLENKAKPQMREILTKFPNLVEIWYDYPRNMNLQQSFEFYKLAYEYQPQALINSRVGNDLGDYSTGGDNRLAPADFGAYKAWETPGTLNNTWGYKSYDNDWKSINEILINIAEIASKGANYLLNVGPDGNGIIPEESVKVLHEVGEWMKVNGEAIYGTNRWIVMKEGPNVIDGGGTKKRKEHGFKTNVTSEDFWFTVKNNYLYIISLKWPQKKEVLIKSFAKLTKDEVDNIMSVQILGCKDQLKWKLKEGALQVILPSRRPVANGYVLKVIFNK